VLISQIREEDRASSVAVLGGPGYRWRAAARARDVTDDLIVDRQERALSQDQHPRASTLVG
jgi:hypothetical protein